MEGSIVQVSDELKPILTVMDVARRHQKSMWTILRRIHNKQLKAYKDGSEWRIRRECLLEYEQQMQRRSNTG